MQHRYRRPRRAPGGADPGEPGVAGVEAEATQLGQLRDSIALVTALLPGSGDDGDVVTGLLADTDADRLLSVSATTAWLASYLVRQLGELHHGAGTAWLQGLTIGLAERS